MKTTLHMTLMALMAALLVAFQVALAMVPNVEVVTIIFIVLSLIFPLYWSVTLAFVFTILEMLIWGYGDWVLSYFIAWPFLVLMTYLMKNQLSNEKRIAVWSGLYGFSFGIYSTLTHMMLYGWNAGIAYYVSGVFPFDIIHGFANFTIALLLSKPLYQVILTLYQRMRGNYVHNH